MSIVETESDTSETGISVKMYSTVDTFGFVEWLEEMMRARSLSHAELARRSGVSRGSISNLLRGERGPGQDMLTRLAIGLDLPREEVFRAAGLLEKPAVDPRIEQIAYFMAALDDSEKDELLAYAEMKFQQASKVDPIEEISAKLATVAPERKGEILDLIDAWLTRHSLTTGRVRK